MRSCSDFTWTDSSPQQHISGCTWAPSGRRLRPGCSMDQVPDQGDLRQQRKSIDIRKQNRKLVYECSKHPEHPAVINLVIFNPLLLANQQKPVSPHTELILVTISHRTDGSWCHIRPWTGIWACRRRRSGCSRGCLRRWTCRGHRGRHPPSYLPCAAEPD